MRFLITSKNKFPMPPEAVPGVLDAMIAWAKKYTGNGKIQDIWSCAGLQAGGGIANVNSLEELDAIMTEFPLGPFSETEIYPLVDLNDALQRMKQVAQAMGGRG
ncbi:MAG: muconolactone Delta-isomerase family protein [Dehalococcoidia bacterium]